MEKLSEEEKCNTELKRIGLQIGKVKNLKTAHEMRITFYGIDDARAHDHDEIILMDQYAGQEVQCSECLKKNEEIRDLKEFIENNKFNNAELTVLLSEEKSKLQASEERVKRVESLLKAFYYKCDLTRLLQSEIEAVENLLTKQ